MTLNASSMICGGVMAVNLMFNWLRFILFNRRHKILPGPEPDRRKTTVNCKESRRILMASIDNLDKVIRRK